MESPGKYSPHSMRIGAATYVALLGYSNVVALLWPVEIRGRKFVHQIPYHASVIVPFVTIYESVHIVVLRIEFRLTRMPLYRQLSA